ncbi:MAG: tetratricopeptide repeat protein [Bacteroidales bacterium]|nr:tetratricopeptide repeat protein [Bacteroidales bacterium]MCF8387793.1 tetratricopeptide repeat protein [Bacteroidales bacterium]MCF8398216.1 tetratricopeptide repeat protein [Bacteroidales bacterium]
MRKVNIIKYLKRNNIDWTLLIVPIIIIIVLFLYLKSINNNHSILQNQIYNPDSLYNYLHTLDTSYWNATGKDVERISDIIKTASLNNDSNLLLFSYFNKGRIYRKQQQFDSAFSAYENALEIAEEIQDEILIANIKLAQGNYYTELDDYYSALQCFTKARQTYEKFDSSQLSKVYNGLGIVYVALGDFKEAISYYKKALAIYKMQKNERSIAGIHLNLAECYIKIKDFEEALVLLKYSENLFKKLNDSIHLSNCYSYFGLMYNAQNQLDSALKYHQLSLDIAQKKGNLRLTGAAMQNIGLLYEKMGEGETAKKYYKQALNMFCETKLKRGQASSLIALSELYRDEGDWETAYNYYIEYIEKRDSIMNAEMQNKIIAYQWKINEQKRRLKMNRLAQELTSKKRQTNILILVVTFVLIIAFFISFLMHRSVKLHEMKNTLLFQQIEAKQKSAELEELKYKNEIESKNKELTALSLQLVTQNDVFENLRLKSDKLFKEKSIDENAYHVIKLLIEDTYEIENKWNQFKTLFEKVHVDFFSKLKARCPSLTENEIRLCAYIKINLQAKEIARLLNISPATIFTNRHHIRKKIGLDKGKSLEDYLRQI